MPDVLSRLIRVQSVCKDYEQTTLVGNELNIDAQLTNHSPWEIVHAFFLSADFFSKSTVSKNSFRNTI